MRLALVVLLVSTTLVAPARASGADDEERARGHYEIALGLYRLGDYHGALKESRPATSWRASRAFF